MFLTGKFIYDNIREIFGKRTQVGDVGEITTFKDLRLEKEEIYLRMIMII